MSKTIVSKEPKYFVSSPSGKPVEVKEMWESFSGWYWYITEFEKGNPNYAYGLVKGFETEWGGIWMPELKEMGEYKVWKVPKKNWSGAPLIFSK